MKKIFATIVPALLVLFFFSSCCKDVQPVGTNTSLEVSRIEKQKLLPVKGGIVAATVKADSIPFMAGPVVIKDTSGRAELRYWRNKYGQLEIECISKDTAVPCTEIETIISKSTENTLPPEVEYRVPWWIWAVAGLFSPATAIGCFILGKKIIPVIIKLWP